jgi:hypothetical protein
MVPIWHHRAVVDSLALKFLGSSLSRAFLHSGAAMIKTIEKAKRVQAKRFALGKRDFSVAVRRFLKRTRTSPQALK